MVCYTTMTESEVKKMTDTDVPQFDPKNFDIRPTRSVLISLGVMSYHLVPPETSIHDEDNSCDAGAQLKSASA